MRFIFRCGPRTVCLSGLGLSIIFAGLLSARGVAQAETPEEARKRLVEQVLIPSGIAHARVLDAIGSTPRHEFVPASERRMAYFDMSLPIGNQQTISSPYIVAYMTEQLDPQPTDRVLEIGTGSGYQAAILSPLVKEVFTIEIVEPLGRRATRTLQRLGYANVKVRIGDGFAGWPEAAPFDKILVTCSPERVPQPLIDQLRDGGSMIVPVGERYQQSLYRFTKRDGKLIEEPLRSTLFVPMTGEAELQRVVQPDPSAPAVHNGDFEQPPTAAAELPGWYYLRQVEEVADPQAPSGKYVAKFDNETPRRSSHALQGLPLDGHAIRDIELSAWICLKDVQFGPERGMQPMLMITFFDARRGIIGEEWLGPWSGTKSWQRAKRSIRVPGATTEAILRIGLFGATGQLFVDDVRITPGKTSP